MTLTADELPYSIRHLSDLLRELGDVPPERVLIDPPPGTATEADLLALLQAGDKRLCELVDGVLVEKPLGLKEAILAGVIMRVLGNYLQVNRLGVAAGADGPLRLRTGLVRLPDLCFISWSRLRVSPGKLDPIPALAPELAIEILSPSNTRREMARKREEYFNAGVHIVWEVDPSNRCVAVFTTAAAADGTFGESDTLHAPQILPGFTLHLEELFAELDGPDECSR